MDVKEDTVLNAIDSVEDGVNKLALCCKNCSSKILNPKVGVFTQENKDLPKMTQKKDSQMVETDLTTDWFRVDDIFKFENIGFSKPVENVKYLICADCELGPVGWSDAETRMSFVALSRVKQESCESVESQ